MQLINKPITIKRTKRRSDFEDQRIAKLIQFYRSMMGVAYKELAEYLDVSIQ